MERKGLRLEWQLLYDCNYRCPYCFDFSKGHKYKRRDLHVSAGEWGKRWTDILERLGVLKIHLNGGEPSIYPSFIELIKQLTDKHIVGMTTNLSGDFETFANEIPPSRIGDWIEASFHPLYADYGEFLKKAMVLKNKGFPIRINYVCYPPQLTSLKHYKQKFEFDGFDFLPLPFKGDYEGKQYPRDYPDDQRKVLGDIVQGKKKIEEIFNHQIQAPRPTKGKLCRAGETCAFIDSDGSVFRCRQARDNGGKVLGNFLNADISLLQYPAPCKEERCFCAEDHLVEKEGDRALFEEITKIKTHYPHRAHEISHGHKPDALPSEEKTLKVELPPPYRVFFNWDIHYSCNYRCSYCFFEGKWEEVAGGNVYPGIQRWSEVWRAIYEKYGECRIDISGGEPTTYPSFFELIAELANVHRVRFNTNLSFDVARFVKDFTPIIKKRGPLALEVSSSFHPQGVAFEDFFNKLKIIKEGGFKLLVTYVAYPPHMGQMYSIKKRIEDEGISCVIQPFRGKYKECRYPEAYNEEERKILDGCSSGVPSELFEHHLKNEKEKEKRLCRMGQVYAKIHPNGETYRCCAQGVGRLGNLIKDDDFSLLAQPAYCELDCPCWKAMIVDKEEKWLHNWEE